MPRLKKRHALIVVGVVVFAWLAASAVVAWRHTHRRSAPFPEPATSVAWGPLEEVRLTTSDQQEIGAWFFHGDTKKPCVLLLHGNGASRAQMLSVMQRLAEAKYTVLSISQRAHGDSTGQINDFGWSARRDVIAAVEFIEKRCPKQPIYIVGRSLGAAAALFAAEELQGRVAGYFLEQPYKDLTSAVWNRLQSRLPPGLDWTAYAGLRLWAPAFLPVEPERVSPYLAIRNVPESIPIVLITGSIDRHAPLDEVKAIFQQAASHAKLVVCEGAAHESLDRKSPDLYWAALLDLLRGTPPEH
jgi:uncharacterized protein